MDFCLAGVMGLFGNYFEGVLYVFCCEIGACWRFCGVGSMGVEVIKKKRVY